MRPLDIGGKDQRSLISFATEAQATTLLQSSAQLSNTLARSRMGGGSGVARKLLLDVIEMTTAHSSLLARARLRAMPTLCMVGPLATNGEEHSLVDQRDPLPLSPRKRRRNGGKVGRKDERNIFLTAFQVG